MLLRTTSSATSASLPLTYLLISEDLIRETQIGFAWSDALAALWSGDFDGTPRLIGLNIAIGLALDETNAALIELADRAHVEGSAPAHLEPHFRARGIEVRAPGLPLSGKRRLTVVQDQAGGRASHTGFGGRA